MDVTREDHVQHAVEYVAENLPAGEPGRTKTISLKITIVIYLFFLNKGKIQSIKVFLPFSLDEILSAIEQYRSRRGQKNYISPFQHVWEIRRRRKKLAAGKSSPLLSVGPRERRYRTLFSLTERETPWKIIIFFF